MEQILSACVPVFGIVACGYVVGRLGILGTGAVAALNRFVYAIGFPALLIHGLARIDIGTELRWDFLGAYAFGLGVTALLALGSLRLDGTAGAKPAAMRVVNATYGNTGYLGIPLGVMIFGEAALPPASLTVVAHSVLVLPIACAMLDAQRGARWWTPGTDTMRRLATNPLLWGVALGLLLAATGATIPAPIDRFLGLLGEAAGPVALISIGLFGATLPARALIRRGAMPSALKLIAFPLAVWLALETFVPLDGMWRDMALLMAAAPLGATAFVLAERSGVERDETSATIIVTTILSLPVFALILSLVATP